MSATKAKKTTTRAKARHQGEAQQPAAAAAAAASEPQPVTAAAAVAAAPAVEARGARTLTGRVVSHKMQKTIAVEIERLVRHPTYGKYIRRTTKLLAHDESGASREGDLVIITPCRPLSRRKSWRLLEVVQKAAAR
ncbi:MAG: 30S ribosomal protein S17 [Gammaproteobacteria bacterium]|nr:30S ribosomal protein S17 [Gammaproteobacteria bacterium]